MPSLAEIAAVLTKYRRDLEGCPRTAQGKRHRGAESRRRVRAAGQLELLGVSRDERIEMLNEIEAGV